MITTPTVLVLGAGASRPYGFPLGGELNKEVQQLLDKVRSDGTHCLMMQVAPLVGADRSLLMDFADALRDADRFSVDAFLEHRPEFVLAGKAAIAAALMPYEDDRRNAIRGDWYQYLFNKMAATPEDFAQNKLSIVTFNYDRSLEFYFERVLRNSFGLGDDEARELRKSVPIIHVHGQLGDLDANSDTHRPYGPDRDAASVVKASQSISIVHEEAPSERIVAATQALEQARIVCFLGFGFHATNIRRLGYTIYREGGDQQIYATTYGLGNDERDTARRLCSTYFVNARRGDGHVQFGSTRTGDVESALDCLAYLKNAPVLKVKL